MPLYGLPPMMRRVTRCDAMEIVGMHCTGVVSFSQVCFYQFIFTSVGKSRFNSETSCDFALQTQDELTLFGIKQFLCQKKRCVQRSKVGNLHR